MSPARDGLSHPIIIINIHRSLLLCTFDGARERNIVKTNLLSFTKTKIFFSILLSLSVRYNNIRRIPKKKKKNAHSKYCDILLHNRPWTIGVFFIFRLLSQRIVFILHSFMLDLQFNYILVAVRYERTILIDSRNDYPASKRLNYMI